MESSDRHRNGPLPKAIGNGVTPIGQGSNDADGYQIWPILEIDLLDVLVFNGNFSIAGSEGSQRTQAQVRKAKGKMPPEASLWPSGTDDFNFHFFIGTQIYADKSR